MKASPDYCLLCGDISKKEISPSLLPLPLVVGWQENWPHGAMKVGEQAQYSPSTVELTLMVGRQVNSKGGPVG